MFHLKAFALAGVAAIALMSAASAADLLPPPPDAPPPPVLIGLDSGGWYIRGDAGVGVNDSFSTSSSPNPLDKAPKGSNDNWYNNALSEAALFDVGVGYQINNWFRVDVTGELRGGSQYSGLEVVNAPSGYTDAKTGAKITDHYADFYKGHLMTALGMFNGYADLGTWYGVTPFVGAGIGVAYNQFSGGTDNGVNNFIANKQVNNSTSGGVLSTGYQANLAWALMAGFDFNVTRNLKLELGYRYLNYGSFKSGSASCLGGVGTPGSFNTSSCSASGYHISSNKLSSNDFKIGLRYYFDAETPPPPAEPLIRKY